jgi:hypothetical protein
LGRNVYEQLSADLNNNMLDFVVKAVCPAMFKKKKLLVLQQKHFPPSFNSLSCPLQAYGFNSKRYIMYSDCKSLQFTIKKRKD